MNPSEMGREKEGDRKWRYGKRRGKEGNEHLHNLRLDSGYIQAHISKFAKSCKFLLRALYQILFDIMPDGRHTTSVLMPSISIICAVVHIARSLETIYNVWQTTDMPKAIIDNMTTSLVYQALQINKALKNSCASCCSLVKNRDGGAEFFNILFHFYHYDKTFRVELAAQECGF